ncbi:MAG: hypothetical protein QGF00_23190 [Planctomycetota bacterium]|jgi:hypothetical protein|nr:hypothetical protein [Planctomycetota bacterium]MDP7252535.1 hypothetical protein [Planctomycetota bacterium]
MNGPLKTFCGLNKYQMFCTVCAGLLIFVCYRTAQPYPEFQVPTTQLVQKQALLASNVSIEEFLQVGPHWADNSRDTFRLHPDYTQRIETIKIAGRRSLPRPNPRKPLHGKTGKTAGEDTQTGQNQERFGASSVRKDFLDQLQKASRAIPTRPESQQHLSSSVSEPIILSPTTTPIPPVTEFAVQFATVDPPVADDPYTLPFRLEGIVKAKEKAPALVILHDLHSGKRFRRFQGQNYEGVIIRKIGPGTVEVEVPSESLQMRYVDTTHRWVTM